MASVKNTLVSLGIETRSILLVSLLKVATIITSVLISSSSTPKIATLVLIFLDFLLKKSIIPPFSSLLLLFSFLANLSLLKCKYPAVPILARTIKEKTNKKTIEKNLFTK